MSIEGIAQEIFSVLPQTEVKAPTKACPRHAVFHYFLLDDNKQYSDTTTADRKSLIGMLKQQNN